MNSPNASLDKFDCAILAALQQDGTPATRVSTGAPEKTEAAPGKLVGLKLGLAAK